MSEKNSAGGARFAIVILAGGAGRRIGGHKADRMLGGRTLLDRACRRADAWSADVAIAGSRAIDEGVAGHWLTDPAGIDGPLAGLASALAFARSRGVEAVLTLPCDTPFLPDDLPGRLLAAMTPDDDAAVPDCGGRFHPASAMWDVRIEPALLDYAATGRRSLMGLLDRVPHARVHWDGEDMDPFFNINTPEELEQAEAWIRRRGPA